MLVSLFLLNTESYCSLNTVISSITEAVATSVTNIAKSTKAGCCNGMIRLHSNKTISTVAIFNVLGVQVSIANFNETQVEIPVTEKGILLVKIIYKDGSVDSMKLYN